MKLHVTLTAEVEVDEKFVELGQLAWLSNPAEVGGAKPIPVEHRLPLPDALAHTLNKPYWPAGSTIEVKSGWNINVQERR